MRNLKNETVDGIDNITTELSQIAARIDDVSFFQKALVDQMQDLDGTSVGTYLGAIWYEFKRMNDLKERELNEKRGE